MKIEVRDDYTIQLEEVYDGITIKTRDGVEFHICQRDYGIEVSCNRKTIYLDESLGKEFYESADKSITVHRQETIEEEDSITTKTHSGLLSFDEHNSNAWATQVNMYSIEPRPNGIACPKCGKELMDTNPNMTLTSYPAQKNVHCPKCGYTGYRIA
jgi:DNA-directed RNA polymerase subunit RPC12/RpoP